MSLLLDAWVDNALEVVCCEVVSTGEMFFEFCEDAETSLGGIWIGLLACFEMKEKTSSGTKNFCRPQVKFGTVIIECHNKKAVFPSKNIQYNKYGKCL